MLDVSQLFYLAYFILEENKLEESVDKRIKRITDYYKKESIEWLRKTIIEIKLAIKNSEKERLIKEQERKNKKSQKEQRLKNKKLANEIKKKNRQLRRNINLNKIKNRKLERLNSIKNNEAKNDILLNIKIPGKGLFLAIELNEKEKAKFYINENKIISLGISPSVNKLACKFFYYRNKISDKDG